MLEFLFAIPNSRRNASAIQNQGMHNTANSHIYFLIQGSSQLRLKCATEEQRPCFTTASSATIRITTILIYTTTKNPWSKPIAKHCHSASCKRYWSKLIQQYSGCSSEAGFVSYTMLLSTLQRPQTRLITFVWDPPSTQHIVESCWSRTTVAPSFTPGINQTCHFLFKVPLTGQIYSS